MAALQMRRNQGNAMRCLFSSRMLRFFLDKTLQKRVLGTLAAFIIPCNPFGGDCWTKRAFVRSSKGEKRLLWVQAVLRGFL